MLGNDKQQEHVVDDDGSNKEGKGGKGNRDGNEGGRQLRGQGQHGPWHRQQGWRATKRAKVTAARAMATRVTGEQWQRW
jgi:hypothetical protein